MFKLTVLICFLAKVVESINHCENVPVVQDMWKNEGVAVIYIMKNSQQNWKAHVSELFKLLTSLENIDVTTNLIIATERNCSTIKAQDFMIDDGTLWQLLEHHNDYPEAYIIDRCGKITYHIIFPWSLVKWFPFIKGAVLSTFFDKPCGPCDDFNSYQIDNIKDKTTDEHIKMYPKTRKNSNRISDEIGPPIEIIIKEKHKHFGSNDVFEYTEMELGNPQYHRHFHSLDDIEFATYETNEEFPTANLLLLDGNKKIETQDHFKHYSLRKNDLKKEIKKSQDQIKKDNIQKIANIDDKIKDILRICGETQSESDARYNDKLFHNLRKELDSSDELLSNDEKQERETMFTHYEKLNNWLRYII